MIKVARFVCRASYLAPYAIVALFTYSSWPTDRTNEGPTVIRVLFAFDPRRAALLLLGGSKTGAWDRWYTENVPVADDLYAAHLAALEGKVDEEVA
jgi:hypothetical protein